MLTMPVFTPSNGEPLVVRSTLGIVPENSSKNHHLPLTRKDFAGNRPATMASARFGNLSQSPFFARHNPHPSRVRHIKGLLDIPICSVHDEGIIINPRLHMRRPATGALDQTRLSLPTRLPVQAINYHPNHINPPLQNHRVNQIDAQKQYRRFPLSMRERSDPTFGTRLNDIPICAVHDEHMVSNHTLRRPSTGEQRRMYAFRVPAINPHQYKIHNQNPTLNSHRFPINTLTGLSTYPLGFKEKANPKFGLIPLTDLWREELHQLTEKAGLGLPKEIKEQQDAQPKRTSVYSADTGRLIPPPSRAMSRGFSRQKQRPRELFHHIAPEVDQESLVMEMLCQILQTDSINAVQAWLCSAGQREKDLVLDMIRGAITNEEEYWKRQQSQDYYDSIPKERPRSQPPPTMMNLQNGYGELDRPDPTLNEDGTLKRIGTPNGYSRYSYEQENDKKKQRGETLFDGQDHPALRQNSAKPDIFKIEHDQRPATRSKSRQGEQCPPPKTPTLRYITTPKDAEAWKPEQATVVN